MKEYKNGMHERKKILFIVEAMGGGVFTYIVNLSNELIATYDLYVAYAVRPQTPANYREYFDKRIHLIEVMNFTRSIDIIKDFKAFFEIKGIAKSINPDAIHLHSSKAGVLGRWAFNGKKVPLFYTPHGYSFLMSNYGVPKRIIYKAIERMSAKRNCTTISCSLGEHQETLKLTEHAIHIDNGINVSEIQTLIDSVGNVSGEEFTVFTLGRICYQKNPALFNNIATLLPEVHFIWIGDGEMKGVLKASNIEVTGWLDRKEALKKSLKANVFLLTSLWEGLPISLLESMYMKKACIVNNAIGSRDVIHNGVNGYLCERLPEFKEAINNCKHGCANDLIEQAYLDVINHYNTHNMALQYKKIYNERLFKAK